MGAQNSKKFKNRAIIYRAFSLYLKDNLTLDVQKEVSIKRIVRHVLTQLGCDHSLLISEHNFIFIREIKARREVMNLTHTFLLSCYSSWIKCLATSKGLLYNTIKNEYWQLKQRDIDAYNSYKVNACPVDYFYGIFSWVRTHQGREFWCEINHMFLTLKPISEIEQFIENYYENEKK